MNLDRIQYILDGLTITFIGYPILHHLNFLNYEIAMLLTGIGLIKSSKYKNKEKG